MNARDALGEVSDRLVGGMMFHADHADMCRVVGIDWLAKLHDKGFLHDSKAHARVRRLCVEHLCRIAPSGRQERTRTLDKWMSVRRGEVEPDEVSDALRQSMRDWCEWERGTAELFASAHMRMLECGHMVIAEEMRVLADDTERELEHARSIECEMRLCGWDVAHAYDMGR